MEREGQGERKENWGEAGGEEKKRAGRGAETGGGLRETETEGGETLGEGERRGKSERDGEGGGV